MKKDAKNAAALILALGKPEKKTSEAEESEEVDDGLTVAAGELRGALESGDDAKLASALKTFIELCQ